MHTPLSLHNFLTKSRFLEAVGTSKISFNKKSLTFELTTDVPNWMMLIGVPFVTLIDHHIYVHPFFDSYVT